MTSPRVVLRGDSPFAVLSESPTAGGGRSVRATTDTLALVADRDVRRTLRARLVREGVDGVRVLAVSDCARALLGARDGHPVRTLGRPVRRRAVGAVLAAADDEDSPLGAFARRVPWRSGDTLEAVLNEFDEYVRCTDAGTDYEASLSLVDTVADANPFAAAATADSLRAFDPLDRRVRASSFGSGAYPSTAHLVSAARSAVDERSGDDGPVAALGDPERVVVAGVGAPDAATLRLVFALARLWPVHYVTGPGTVDRLRARLTAGADRADVAVEDRTDADGGGPTEALGRLVRAAADGATTRVEDGPDGGVELVAAPDARREAEAALDAAWRVEGDSLVVARGVDAYRTHLRDVALTADRPVRFGTPRPVAATTPVEAVLATVSALAAGEGDGPVDPDRVVEPFRLGAVPPRSVLDGDADVDDWPLPTPVVRAVADALSGPASMAVHRRALSVAGVDDRAVTFVGWLADRRSDPPAEGVALVRTIESMLVTTLSAAATRALRPVEGVGVRTGRARVATPHPAAVAAGARRALPAVADAYDRLVNVPGAGTGTGTGTSPDWATARTALRAGLDGETVVPRRRDGSAVDVVDVGDAAFRTADHVVVLGLSAGSFPRRPRRPAFLHRAVRDALARRPGDVPFLHLDGEATTYERDLDAYANALGTVAGSARPRVTLVRPYKDANGRDVAASPFLDAVEFDARRRVGADEWTFADRAAPDPPKDRLRALARETDRPTGSDRDADDLRAVVADVDARTRRLAADRVERFRSYLAAQREEEGKTGKTGETR